MFSALGALTAEGLRSSCWCLIGGGVSGLGTVTGDHTGVIDYWNPPAESPGAPVGKEE